MTVCDAKLLEQSRALHEEHAVVVGYAEQLMARRNELWRKAKASGCSPTVLGETWGVTEVAVRQALRRLDT